MTYTEKNTLLFGLIAIGGYGVYLALVLPQAADVPLWETAYVGPMLATIIGAIVVGILGGIVLGITSRGETARDARDREIEELGDRVGNSMIVIAAVGAIVLAWLELAHFWIANAVYLGFVLAGVLSTMARLAAYRRGL